MVSLIRGSIEYQRLEEAATVHAAQQLYPPGREPPALVIVCQSWSDQFSAAEIHTLLAWLPFARLICCYGPWCDSDGRTRDLWPLAVRVSAADAEHVVADALRELQMGGIAGSVPNTAAAAGNVSRRLPLTASRSEVYEARHAGKFSTSLKGLTVAVSSADRSWKQMIEHLVLGQKGVVVDLDDPEHARSGAVQVLLWDADPVGPERRDVLVRCRKTLPTARIVAYVGFPRADLAEELHRWGATRVCSKVAPLGDLVEVVAELGRRS